MIATARARAPGALAILLLPSVALADDEDAAVLALSRGRVLFGQGACREARAGRWQRFAVR